MRAARAWTALVLAVAASAAPASVFYKFDVVAQTGQGGIVSLGTGPSVNEKGKVGYVGRYANGPSVFVWSPVGGSVDVATNFLSTGRNFGEAVRLNRLDEMATWNRLLPLGLYEVRVFRTATPNDSSVMVRALAGTQRYELLYQNPAMNANRVLEDRSNTMTGDKDGVCEGSETCVSQIAYNGLITIPNRVLGTVEQNPTDATDGGQLHEYGLNTSQSRPAMADDGRIVVRAVLPSNPILLFDYELGSPTTIAGSGQGFTALGAAPGISDDGRVVAFAGNRGHGDGIFLSLEKAGGGRRLVRIAGENATVPKAELGFDGTNQKLYFQSIDLDARVGVTYTPGPDGTPNGSIVVAFVGTPNAASRINPGTGKPFFFSAQKGIWTMRIDLAAPLFENVCMVRAPGVTGNPFTVTGDDAVGVANGIPYVGAGPDGVCDSENGHDVETLFSRAGPIPVVQVGDRIGPGTVAGLAVHDPIATARFDDLGNARANRAGDHHIAFWADVGGGTQVVVRAEHLDSDQDGLMDHWETIGIDLEGTGTIDLDLAAMGADPQRRDFFMQMDYAADRPGPLNLGERHLPMPGMIRRLAQFYAGAPALPSGVPAGIRLHFDSGNTVDLSGQPVSRNMGAGPLRGGKLVSGSPIDILYFGVPGSVTLPGVIAQSFDGIKVANLWNTDRGARELAFTYIVWADFHHAFPDSVTPIAGTATGGNSFMLKDANNFLLQNYQLSGHGVKITAGTGAGQLRRIAQAGTLTATGEPVIQLASPWTVIPDATSQYVVFDGSGGESSPGMRYDGAFAPGKNFALTLGSFGASPPGNEQGGFLGQWQTLAHEIGHDQGLMHGGNNHVNFKANYVSFMNYAYELCTSGVGTDAAGNALPGAASCPVVDYAGAADAVHNDWASLNMSSALNLQRMGQAFGNALDPATLPFPPTPDDQTIADIERRFPNRDTTVPTISGIAPAGGSNVAIGAGIAVSFNAVDNVGVVRAEVLFDRNGDGVQAEPAEVFAASSGGGALFTAAVPAVSGPAGPRKLVVAAYDQAGNVGYATVTLTVGAVAPAAVPTITALPLDVARTALYGAHFGVGTITRAASASVPAGNVISQVPAAGSVQPLGTPVSFVVSLGANGALVPDVRGLTQAAAANTLTAAGFAAGAITQGLPGVGVPGTVASQTPDAGAVAALGSAVGLLVTSGAANVTVPNVVGLPQASATSALATAGLVAGTVTSQASPTVPAGNVISQSPLAGTTVPAGSAVALVVSLGPVCAVFTDVLAASPFCSSVEWMRNRAITLGCTGSAYCPNADVNRLAMAAFMTRLGPALAPSAQLVEQAPGPFDPGAAPVQCIAPAIVVTGAPRRVRVDGLVSVLGSVPGALVVDLVVSLNGGATWTPLAAHPVAASIAAGRWTSIRAVGARDLAVGDSATFGLRVSRGALGGTAAVGDSHCRLRVVNDNRQGTIPPFDR